MKSGTTKGSPDDDGGRSWQARLRQSYLRDCEGGGTGRSGKKNCGAILSLLRDWRLLLNWRLFK